MTVWRTGDRVTIQTNVRTIDGVVRLASPNGRSLMLEFEAIIDGHVGMMPVLMHDDGVFRSIVTDLEVTLSAVN